MYLEARLTDIEVEV